MNEEPACSGPADAPGVLDPPELRDHRAAPEGISGVHPATEATRREDSRRNATISGVTANVSTSATHQGDALPLPEIASARGRAAYPRTAEEEAPRKAKGGPCQNSSAVSEEVRRGGGRKRRRSPSAHLERPFIPAHPDAQRRRGGGDVSGRRSNPQ